MFKILYLFLWIPQFRVLFIVNLNKNYKYWYLNRDLITF